MPQARDRGKVLLSAPKLPQFKGAAAKTGVPPEGNILLFLFIILCVCDHIAIQERSRPRLGRRALFGGPSHLESLRRGP